MDKCESVLIANNCFDTIIGSDRTAVDIHLCGPLIAPIHALVNICWGNFKLRVFKKNRKITKNIDLDEVHLEQLAKTHVTYVNGDDVKTKIKLNHGDRIIFGLGGSNYFRFNNPTKLQQKLIGGNLKNEFKDYQYAKDELQNKQIEAPKELYENELKKCKQESDLKIKTVCHSYEQNIEKIVKLSIIDVLSEIFFFHIK